MTTSTSGAPLAITLDGVHLTGVSPEDVEDRPDELVTHRQASAGAVRESRPPVDPGAAAKVIKITHVLSYAHLGREGWAGRVDRMLAIPGLHRLITWKHRSVAFAGDGATRVFTFPRAFAQDALGPGGTAIVPPSAHPWARFSTEVYLAGPTGVAVIATRVPQATWDGGDPAAGVVWQLEGAPQIKLAPADAPAAGAWLTVSAVPEYSVLAAPAQAVTYRSAVREPRRLELREA